ncbi:MAG: RNA-directed DNA polymerase, partial [Bacteroides sp.]|nr:RNA-directed DNA polymerase [Bacteroides sp.]
INIVLTELDRFVKEVLKVKYYFRYMDDIVIFHDEKSVLHEWQWRIMNFCWYKLHFLMNSKRQIFPVGTNRTERGNDFGGYVFRRKYTLIRKRIKKSFARNRHKPKSVTSYKGLVMHCNGRNLVNKIINKNNMNLSELGLKRIERPFEGDSIKIEV